METVWLQFGVKTVTTAVFGAKKSANGTQVPFALGQDFYFAARIWAALRVFCRSMTRVMGPTPPGAGVM